VTDADVVKGGWLSQPETQPGLPRNNSYCGLYRSIGRKLPNSAIILCLSSNHTRQLLRCRQVSDLCDNLQQVSGMGA
jgi:hypothetical protein